MRAQQHFVLARLGYRLDSPLEVLRNHIAIWPARNAPLVIGVIVNCVRRMAQIGETRWKSSVFPQNKQSEWILLVSKKVMRAEDLAPDETVEVTLELL